MGTNILSSPIVAGVLATLGSALILHLLRTGFRDRVRVRRITKSSDPLVPGTLDLYCAEFPEEDGTNYSIDEVMGFLDAVPSAKRHVEVENIVLAATFRSEVVGFVSCHVYPLRRKAIVSYCAIDRSVKEARVNSTAANKLLRKLKAILVNREQCDVLFYDVERIGPSTPPQEGRRKRGRQTIFRSHAKTLHLEARQFQIAYQSPRVSLSDYTHEEPFVLFCVGINNKIPKTITKKQMMQYLSFIYLDCYGDVYPVADPRFRQHQAHLRKILAHYEKTLPDVIPTA